MNLMYSAWILENPLNICESALIWWWIKWAQASELSWAFDRSSFSFLGDFWPPLVQLYRPGPQSWESRFAGWSYADPARFAFHQQTARTYMHPWTRQLFPGNLNLKNLECFQDCFRYICMHGHWVRLRKSTLSALQLGRNQFFPKTSVAKEPGPGWYQDF